VKLSYKIVTSIPLNTLWTSETEVQAERTAYIRRNDIKLLLKDTPVQFIVADVGHKLRWIDSRQCFEFWKTEAAHVAENPERVDLENFVGNYAYVASRWSGQQDIPIILLEKVH